VPQGCSVRCAGRCLKQSLPSTTSV
jgi:hypothetical protein